MNVVLSSSLAYEIFIRSVAAISGILSLTGAFVPDTRAIPEGRRPLSVVWRIIAFLSGVALLLVAFGILK